MKYPFFASFIILSLLLMYKIRKRREKEEKLYDSFWEEENKANSTRKQSLENLNYITIPFDTLPMDIHKEDPEIKECYEALYTLSENPIVNFTGLTNTELKLSYGAANLETLSAYDQSYTFLVRTLDKLSRLLYKNGYTEEAKAFLEFSVSTNSDVSSTYSLLGSIYKEGEEFDKIKELIEIADSINSIMSKSIVKGLTDLL